MRISGVQRVLSAVTIALLGGTGFIVGVQGRASRMRNKPAPKAPDPGDRMVPGAYATLDASGGLNGLAQAIRERVPLPVEALECAAVLESLGVTHEVAATRYGAPDAFVLAARVHDLVRSQSAGVPLPAEPAAIAPPTHPLLGELARGPLSLLVVVALFLALTAYRRFGEWGEGNVLAMSVGLTGSMVIANVFIQGAARRGAIYVSRGNPRAAFHFLLRALLPAVACVLAVTILGALLAEHFRLLSADGARIFAASFVFLALLWFSSALLSIFQLQGWFALGLAVGLLSGVLADRAVHLLTPLHLTAGTVVGLATTLLVFVHPVRRTLALPRGATAHRPLLPSSAYLLREAAPYFGYGLTYVALLLTPHILGWTGRLDGMTRMQAVSTLEVALTLTVAPVLLAEGLAERAARRLWPHARAVQEATPAAHRAYFGPALIRFWRGHFAAYLLVLGSLTAAGALAVWSHGASIGRIFELAAPEVIAPLACASLAGYFFLGCGLFNCVFCVTLARPQAAASSALVGLAVTIVLGLPLALLGHYSYALIGFIAGAAAFAFASTLATLRTLRSADYYYVASF